MKYTLFFLLCALSLFYLLRGMRTRDGIYQFPVIFSAAFAFSIVPQLVNHVFYPPRLPQQVYDDHGVEYGLLMCILCLVAGNWGYAQTPRHGAPGLRRLLPDVDPEKLFWAGAVLCLIGLYGATKVTELAGGFQQRFMGGGHYDLEWTGAPVFWTYVGKMLWIGLPLCLISALRRGTLVRWLFIAGILVYPLLSIVFLGRRSGTFGLAAIIALSLWFQKRWALPRPMALGALALGGALIIFMPYYRKVSAATGNIALAIEELDTEDAVEAYLQGERGEGMDNLIIGIPARLAVPSFHWGTGFWNASVEHLVPAQIVGRVVKEGLKLRVGKSDEEVFGEYCGQGPEYGSFTTGPYSAFREFWFTGCLLFAGVGWFYRRVWWFANESRDLGAQVVYTGTGLLPAMAVVDSLTSTFPMFLLAVGVMLPAMWLARRRGEAGWASRKEKRYQRSAGRRRRSGTAEIQQGAKEQPVEMEAVGNAGTPNR